MNELLRIDIRRRTGNQTIIFGIPETDEEIQEMFKVRYKAYLNKGHINGNGLGLDEDHFDVNKLCHYFIAVEGKDRKIIGSTRMIFGSVLPTLDEYFELELPEAINAVSRGKIVEIGRLSSLPRDTGLDVPRHLVLLGLFLVMFKFAKERGYLLAIGSLKDYVKRKLDIIKFPLHIIKNHKLIYNPKEHNDPLVNFFKEDQGKVWPVYCTPTEIEKYLNSIFYNKKYFKMINDSHLELKGNWRFKIALVVKSIIS